MINPFPKEQAQIILENMYNYATILLNNPEKVKRFCGLLQKEERPEISELRSLFLDYANHRYMAIDFESMMKVCAALIYFILPEDWIPDTDQEIGFLDDDAVLDVCKKLVQDQLNAYRIWQENQN